MFNDAATVVAANAIDGVITHIQAHSGARGASGTSNAIGAKVPVNGTVDADGDLTWTNVAFSGLPASGPVAEFSYWGGAGQTTYYGGSARTIGDATANSAGEYLAENITESSTAS